MSRRALQLVLDTAVLAIAFTLAYVIRFDGFPPPVTRHWAAVQAPYVVLLELLVLSLVGLHKTSWRYISLADIPRIGIGVGLATVILVALRLGLPPRFAFGRVPLGVIAANAMLVGFGLLSARILRRVTAEYTDRRRLTETRKKPNHRILLIGAGQAGVLVAKELLARPDLGMQPVGFVDDDAQKIGTYIHGLKVLGDTQSLTAIVEEQRIEEVVIAIANATGATVRRILSTCESIHVPVKIIPGLYEIISGRVNVSRIRQVAIEDLLGREEVSLDREGIAAYLAGRRVLVTGAGGSIGSELCRQIARFEPESLVMLEQAENPLFYIEQELRKSYPDLRLRPVIADICDSKRLRDVFERFQPEVVFHAAAHKHVPMMEMNPGEAVKNNVFGTKKVADAADAVGCGVMVMISTDKAVNPTSVMGATKRLAELYIQSLAKRSKTKFVAVRFGNVLGSSGSVIPTFKKQIEEGGPVTVTHPDMKRYFMTIPEACQLVMQAASMAEGGEIFVLDMGKPVKIVDLARDMIRLSGLREGLDVRVEFTGLRPGEKLFEELAFSGEQATKTRHPKVFIGKLEAYPEEKVQGILERLGAVTETSEAVNVREVLKVLLPEFSEPVGEISSAYRIPGDVLEITPARGVPRV